VRSVLPLRDRDNGPERESLDEVSVQPLHGACEIALLGVHRHYDLHLHSVRRRRRLDPDRLC